jgi:membrane-bound acyltransferase YfiQ involved in biofilm formation
MNMVVLFIAGILIDLFLGNFIGRTSLILLIFYLFGKMIFNFLPKKTEKNLKLKL